MNEEMIVFEWLKNWFVTNKNQLEQQNISFTFSKIRTDVSKPSQVVDIEKHNSFAQIILWNSGECDIAFVEQSGEQIKYFEYQVVESEMELNALIESLFEIF